MRAYPQYKDSDVEWLGKIPENWKVVRLNSEFIERKEKVSDKDYSPLSVTKKGILPQLETAAKSNDGDNRKKVCKDNFVINSRSDRKGSSGISPYTGSVSLINTVLHAFSLDKLYVHNFFRSHVFQEEFYRVGRGIVADLWSTKYSDMSTIMIPKPSSKEQQKIAHYLDWKTSQINQFINAKKKLITLLKEQKQNIINESVTKGIDPKVKMKNSGIAWLGEIPDHWQIKKLKYCANIKNGKDFKTVECDSGYPVYGSGGQFSYASNYLYDGASVLFGRKGTIDKPLLVDKKFWTVDTMFYTEINKTIIMPFYLYLIALTIPFAYYSTQTALPSMTQNDLKNHLIALPLISEQKRIISHIQKETTLIDKTINRAEKEIQLIQEYRTRLISDVITGKIDVRAEKIPKFTSVTIDSAVTEEDNNEDEVIMEATEA